ncbi:MAG TPA: methyltransferase domain-containing protein [Xanthomonadaceae bacterium]|nr:methyltransferase domain-containing protein [Xanthomonadaceae bacterium]
MLTPRQADPMCAFSEPRGQVLLALAQARVQPLVDGVYGPHALLLAPDASHFPELAPPMVGLRLRIGRGARLDGDLIASAEDLPLPSDSMALVVVQYALRADQAEAVLAECARVLAPGGVALVMGINPLSLWRLWSRRHAAGATPGASACRRILAREDVETLQVRHFGPFLPIGRADAAGEATRESRWLGPLRASFLLIARKQRAQPTTLRFSRVEHRAAVSPGLAGSFRKAS